MAELITVIAVATALTVAVSAPVPQDMSTSIAIIPPTTTTTTRTPTTTKTPLPPFPQVWKEASPGERFAYVLLFMSCAPTIFVIVLFLIALASKAVDACTFHRPEKAQDMEMTGAPANIKLDEAISEDKANERKSSNDNESTAAPSYRSNDVAPAYRSSWCESSASSEGRFDFCEVREGWPPEASRTGRPSQANIGVAM
ncbi:uncharacterized protein LOC62_06G007827 [Vanrija pseudolonga]|uniref:Uncharacterized protein n=1 Tax=Vanrija pseudolonga TaxID=143232 RepID=A0AAF0YI00_9TREE|nr:hypothetical protein LOC62_06G007827 [Vanrija pseudolonga]